MDIRSTQQNTGGNSSKIFRHVNSTQNLYDAWISVRSKERTSAHKGTREAVQQIDANPASFIRKLQSQIRADEFEFPPQRGVVKKKSSGKKRGIVVSPVEGRIVQRAILNTLQSDKRAIADLILPIRQCLEVPTSIGGVPKRGVQHGVELIREAVKDGRVHYARSDIKSFFDKVDRVSIVNFLKAHVPCVRTVALFEEAMSVEFENEDEIKEDLSLFPGELGVPQGNSLSSLAANIALRDFDAAMNERGIVTIRYVDDFIVLGKSKNAVSKALKTGTSILNGIGLTAYTPEQAPDKASYGTVQSGVEFIGCYLRGEEVSPSSKTKSRLLEEVDKRLANSIKDLRKCLQSEKSRRAEERYLQTLGYIDRKVRGWGDAYQFTTDNLHFENLDLKLEARLGQYKKEFNDLVRNADWQMQRRLSGIALLADTPMPKTKSPS